MSLPPAIQWFFHMALSPSMLTKSRPSPASFLSKSLAVTSTVSEPAKRRAVDFMIAKASGRISSSFFSMASSSSFTSLSDSVARDSFSLTGVSLPSSFCLISSMRFSKGASTSFRASLRRAVCSLSSSFDRVSIVLYASSTLSRIGLRAFISFSDLVPKTFFIAFTTNPIVD